MSGAYNIQYLTNSQIDKNKWDKCIGTASNGLVYGYSFYLDAMAKNWDALVLSKEGDTDNEYEAVMPLTWNKKFGFNYLYQPFLTAQLGIFGKSLSHELIKQFIQHIPASFRLVEISLNSKNLEGVPADSIVRSNYILDLQNSYDILFKNYRENTQRNIKKSIQLGCTMQKDFDAELVIKLAVEQMKTQGNEGGENVDRFRKLYQLMKQKQMATTYGILSARNELLASCVFFFSHNRAYYILVGNHAAGKNTGASHALIDAFIKDNAGRNLLLDFEGSDIPSLAFFYNSFGAVKEVYPALKINRLPFYLKWLKK